MIILLYIIEKDQNEECWEANIEDVVCQAPNPSNTPKPSKDFDNTTPNESKPSFDSRTRGYLSPKTYENDGKKTLVLDLDETMIHSWFKPIRDPDIFLEVKIKNKFSKIYVLVRPGVQEFLKKMQKLYEVVFFTASVSTYAIPLINKLDRNRYKHQMLFRQHWDVLSGSFVKDLSKIGRDLKDVIILDNTPNWYRLQKSNALPIVTWFDDPADRELLKLIPLLK